MLVRFNRENFNSFLIVLFMFSSAICLPIHILTKSGFMIWIVTFGILFASLLINKFIFNKKFLNISLVLIIIFLINLTFFNFKNIIINIFIEFIKFALIPLYLTSQDYSFKKVIYYWYRVGIINFIIWLFMIIFVIRGRVDYMFFGVYMTYSFIIFIYNYYKMKKKKDLVMSIISLGSIFMFGNRAAWAICGVIWLYLYIISNKKSINKFIVKCLILSISILVLYNNFIYIMSSLQSFLLRVNINSYSINKLINAYNNGFITTMSGRDELYSVAIEIIKNNNLKPLGIGYFRVVTGSAYPHNFILEYIITFGILGLVVLPFIVWYLYKKYSRLKSEKKLVSNLLIIFIIIRLSMSSSFFIESMLWILLGFLIFDREICNKEIE